MHARVVLGVGKGVLFREVSSVQGCPHRERERCPHFIAVLIEGFTVLYLIGDMLYLCTASMKPPLSLSLQE